MPGSNLIRWILLLLLVLVAFASTVQRSASGAEPTQTSPVAGSVSTGVLLLRDGGVLTGNISQAADHYIVTRGGAQIRIPAANVALVCGTLAEAYTRQLHAIQSPTAEAHLTLADWCLQNGLYPQAAQELVAARGLDPRLPKLDLLERRLAAISQPPPPPATSVAATAPENPPSPPAVPVRPQSMRADELPNGVVERFTRKVQPLLVNNCTSAGCHRPGGPQSFELDRAILHGMANRRSTTHNLEAVLALVDHERPQESLLLTIPRQDHAGMDHPILGPRQSAQIQQLIDWVAMVTGSPSSTNGSPATDVEQAIASPTELVPSPTHWREPISRVSYDRNGKVLLPTLGKKQAADIRSDAEDASIDAAAFDDVAPPFAPSPIRYGVRMSSWQPKDPFDAEIFNRQSRPAEMQNAATSKRD